MPYIVTTGQRFRYADANVGGVQIESRRAVATLDVLIEAVGEILADTLVNPHPWQEVVDRWDEDPTPNVIGPLPDGTVITVESATGRALFEALPEVERTRLLDLYGNSLYLNPTAPDITILVDAYNAAQEGD